MIVGHVEKMSIYRFEDGTFSFHTAHQHDGTRVIFRCKMNKWPSTRAKEKQIPYKRLVNSSDEEIMKWRLGHPTYPVKEVVPLP